MDSASRAIKPTACMTGLSGFIELHSLLLQCATLLRIADREDHLFVVNHLLRLPPGAGAWMAPCLQMVDIPEMTSASEAIGHPLFDHCVALLDLLMQPVP